MNKTVSFSFDSQEDKQEFKVYAASKGMTLSVLAKIATYQYRAKYPPKLTGRENIRKEKSDAKTVQSCTIGEGLNNSLETDITPKKEV
jgi:hypothetical protein